MKIRIYTLVAISLISAGLCNGAQVYTYNPASAWYETPADYSIVNAIRSKSDLSQADVDKYKLLRLGSLQNVTAGSLGVAATYAAGTKTYEGLDMLGSYGPSSDNKFWWALAGAAGIGFGVYKFLYPRIQAGVLNQITTFIDMCENLDVYNFSYSAADLNKLGTSQTNVSGASYNPKWLMTNAAWIAGARIGDRKAIARKKALDNLLEQCTATIQLIAELRSVESPVDTNTLHNRATRIQSHLNNNNQVITHAAQQEAQERAQQVAAGQAVVRQEIQLAQNRANVQVAQQQASALWYGKISLAVTAFSNFFDKSLKTLVYVNDNKEKIVGGLLIGSAAVYGSLIWLQSKLMGK